MKGLLFVLLCTVLSIFSCKNFPIGNAPAPVDQDNLNSLDSAYRADSALQADSVAHADSIAKMAKK